MNIDLLTKLVRLANNNPNEHEANLAARKACKLIEEGKFQFGQQPVTPSRPTVNNPPRNYRPAWTDSPYSGGKDPFDWFKDIFREMNNAAYQSRKDYEPAAKPEGYDKFAQEFYERASPFTESTKRPTEHKESRTLKCTKCGHIVTTKYVGLAEVFQCNTCQWTAYQEAKDL